MRTALTILVFLAALLAPLFVRWFRLRRWGLPVRVVVDPDDPRPEAVAGYLAEIARRLDERPGNLRVVFDGRNVRNRAVSLDVDADRALRVKVDGHRPHRLDLRGRWIPDHPVPLDLRRAVLYVKPVDANRFRVATSVPFSAPVVLHACASLVAAAGLVWLQPEALATALGWALGCLVASRGR